MRPLKLWVMARVKNSCQTTGITHDWVVSRVAHQWGPSHAPFCAVEYAGYKYIYICIHMYIYIYICIFMYITMNLSTKLFGRWIYESCHIPKRHSKNDWVTSHVTHTWSSRVMSHIDVTHCTLCTTEAWVVYGWVTCMNGSHTCMNRTWISHIYKWVSCYADMYIIGYTYQETCQIWKRHVPYTWVV